MPIQNLIPSTAMRLKPYTALYALPGGMFFSSPSDWANALASLPASAFVLVGAVQKCKLFQARGKNDSYAELNAATDGTGTFGAPVETYPGLPKYKVTMSRIMLQNSNFLQAFGVSGTQIIKQLAPLIAQIYKPVPRDAKNNPLVVNGKPLVDEYITAFGLWMDKNDIEFDVTSPDLPIIQEIEMVCTGFISSLDSKGN